MIIKSVRIKARGSVTKRTLDHVLRGDENDEITIVQGTERDVQDALNDARARSRVYAIRHFIVSPGQACTREQMLDVVSRLGTEFGFDPGAAVVIEHSKARVHAALFTRHLHVLVPEVDPIDGKTLSSSHSFARQEKVARLAEHSLGHPLTPGPHSKAVVAALRKEGHGIVADLLERVMAATPDASPAEAFSTASHQKAAREGYDLPALKAFVALAWLQSTTRDALEVALAEQRLRVVPGQKPRTYIVETDDGTFLGSLDRLSKARKAAILSRMENDHVEREEDRNLGGGNDPRGYPGASPSHGASGALGGQGTVSGGAEPDRHPHPASEGDVGRGGAGSLGTGTDHRDLGPTRSGAGSARDVEGVSAANVRIALEVERHEDTIAALLDRAKALASPAKERVPAKLAAIVTEANFAGVMATSSIAKAAELQTARSALEKATAKWGESSKIADDALRAYNIAFYHQPPWWRRLLGRVSGHEKARVIRVEALRLEWERKWAVVERDQGRQLGARQILAHAERRHHAAQEAHRTEWVAKAEQLKLEKEAAETGLDLYCRLPGLVHVGEIGLLELGRRVAEARNIQRELNDSDEDVASSGMLRAR